MIERIKAKMAQIDFNPDFHRLVYGGLAVTYGFGFLGADKDLIYLLGMALYFVMAVR